MAQAGAAGVGRRPRIKLFVAVGVIAVVVLLALVLVPARSQAAVLTISPGSSPTAAFSFVGPSYVTMHFASPAGYEMRYWMSGSSGMMYDHSMMGGGGMMGGGSVSDSYTFWTWGGQYTCGAAYINDGPGSMPVWVNATSALL